MVHFLAKAEVFGGGFCRNMDEHDGIEEISVRVGSSASTGGSDSRWVDGTELDAELPSYPVLDEIEGRQGYGSLRRRLLKRPKRVDSFDGEAMEIAGAHGHNSKVTYNFYFLVILNFKFISMV